MSSISLYYRCGASDKEYHVEIAPSGAGFVVNFAYGRRGSTLQTGSKTPSPVAKEKAVSIMDKLVKEKMAKGYTQGAEGTPYAHTDKAERSTGISPQLLNPIDEEEAAKLVENPSFWMQQKFDGRRLLVRFNSDGTVVGINRKGLTVGLPENVVAQVKKIGEPCLIDGEAVGDHLFAFDILEKGGVDLRPLPYSKRLATLLSIPLFEGAAFSVAYTALTTADKKAVLDGLKMDKAEGVVFKNKNAPYVAGRPASGGNQFKCKFYATGTFIVTAVSASKRSVSLGLLDADAAGDTYGIVPLGKVTILPNFEVPKPGALVEVRYLYAYKGGSIYQPVYQGERDDIERSACSTKQLKFKAENDDEG